MHVRRRASFLFKERGWPMRRTYFVWALVAAAVIFGPVELRRALRQRPHVPTVDLDLVSAGEILFNHVWQPNDPLCAGGDGLGPVFNAKSCVACHHQGGPGGSGGLEHNVTTFSTVRHQSPREGVLHAFATAPEYQETLTHVDSALPPISHPALGQLITPTANGKIRNAVGQGAIVLPNEIQLSQRRTPALFGAGLIDAIPEQVIVANQRQQELRHGMAPGGTETIPVGRVSRLANGKIGRFGWKAQTASLADFVQAACASELGLGNPGMAQPRLLAVPVYAPSGLDLTQLQCDQITAFVAALPAPVERLPQRPDSLAHSGKAIFTRIGCADCHAPTLGNVDGIYSDLLLHRMGMDLQSINTSYGGESIPTQPKNTITSPSQPLADEWRTPPLWGVADAGPYLHDGRAATLEDAIRLHGGQGASAAAQFQALGPVKQSELLVFLRSLRAS
jgi:CxxC motif-containing protein (DUF1111 family)